MHHCYLFWWRNWGLIAEKWFLRPLKETILENLMNFNEEEKEEIHFIINK